MTTSQTGIDLIKEFEGCILTAYLCPAGVWTIGYGHTAGVTQGMVITQEQAEAYLRSDLTTFEAHVSEYGSKYGWNQNEFDALVSFAFNIGNINQLTADGTRDRDTIASKIPEYNKSGGTVLSGLVRRRAAEQELFLRFYDTGEENTGNGGDTVGNVKTYSLAKNGGTYLTTNFKASEMACKDGSDYILIDLDLMDILQRVRDWAGAAVTITSGYRNATYNAKVGGASNSYHTKGQAADIVVTGKSSTEVAAFLETIGAKGIMDYQTQKFTHVDTRSTKYWAKVVNGATSGVSTFGGAAVAGEPANNNEEDLTVEKYEELKALINAQADTINSLKSEIAALKAENPVYNEIEDVPDYWREETQELVDTGAIQGDGEHGVAKSRSVLEAVIVSKRYTDQPVGKGV